MDIKDFRDNASKAANRLKSLANSDRLMILCQLIEGEKSAGELAKLSDLSQSAFSQHLAVLRNEQLVSTRKEAQTVFYRLANDEVVRILETLHGIYCK